jgi:hypothetical protein
MRAARIPGGALMCSAASIAACFSRGRAMQDLIFIGLIVALYAVTHALVVGLARLGRIE